MLWSWLRCFTISPFYNGLKFFVADGIYRIMQIKVFLLYVSSTFCHTGPAIWDGTWMRSTKPFCWQNNINSNIYLSIHILSLQHKRVSWPSFPWLNQPLRVDLARKKIKITIWITIMYCNGYFAFFDANQNCPLILFHVSNRFCYVQIG